MTPFHWMAFLCVIAVILFVVTVWLDRWFDTGIAFDHLRVQSLHRRLSDIESMGYRVDRAKHPEIQRAKIYRITGKAA